MLHPLFGAGEDRNGQKSGKTGGKDGELHPLFGAGEDRNGVEEAEDAATEASCTRSSERVRIATCAGRWSARTAPSCTRSSERVRIATSRANRRPPKGRELHPLFGAGEDRNRLLPGVDTSCRSLHPLFGAGEDRNELEIAAANNPGVAAPALRSG